LFTAQVKNKLSPDDEKEEKVNIFHFQQFTAYENDNDNDNENDTVLRQLTFAPTTKKRKLDRLGFTGIIINQFILKTVFLIDLLVFVWESKKEQKNSRRH